MKRIRVARYVTIIVLLSLAVYVANYSPLAPYLTEDSLEAWISKYGLLAPLIFIMAYALAIPILISSTLMTTAGAVLFGPYLGFIFNFAGAVSGSILAFFASRTFARGAIKDFLLSSMKPWDEKFKSKGLATVLTLRLIYFPFGILSLGAGVTKIKFKDYFWGTFFGEIFVGFTLTFFAGKIALALLSKHWSAFLDQDVLIACGLLISSFIIALFVKKIQKRFFE